MKTVVANYALRLAASKSIDPTPLLGWGGIAAAALAIAASGWIVIGYEKAEKIWAIIVMALACAATCWRYEIAVFLGI
jgi:hypothetical protein